MFTVAFACRTVFCLSQHWILGSLLKTDVLSLDSLWNHFAALPGSYFFRSNEMKTDFNRIFLHYLIDAGSLVLPKPPDLMTTKYRILKLEGT